MASKITVSKVKKAKKIIWALDPFSELKSTWKRSEEVLRALTAKGNILIEPVFVLGSASLNWVGEITPPHIDHFLPITQKAMEKIVKRIDMPNILPPKVIVNKRSSKGSDVKELMKYASQRNAQLIVVNTHARKGIKKVFLGSFAERVLSHSRVPMIFVSPNTLSHALCIVF